MGADTEDIEALCTRDVSRISQYVEVKIGSHRDTRDTSVRAERSGSGAYST